MRQLEEKERGYQQQLTHASRLSIVGELASGIAHELNQPLGAIATFSDGCRRLIDAGEADSPELRDALVQISAQAQRSGEIIRRMRQFVRKQERQFARSDLNAVVRESLQLVQASKTRLGVGLCLDLAPGRLSVLADRIQLQQVIINLVQNGLDAMCETDSHDCTLTIQTTQSGPDKVELTVVDQGKGLSNDDIKRVFEPFFSTKAEGLGIGLSISQSIIEAHGGRIWVKQNQDQGLTFGFSLPMA